LERPGREAALLVHSEIRKSDNTGVQAAHFAKRAAGSAARLGRNIHSRLQFRPYRAVAQAEKKAVKANVNALYHQSLRQNPRLAKANPLKKALHKRKIKRDHAKAFRRGGIEGVKKAAQKAGKTVERTVKALVKRGSGGIALAVGGLLLLIMLLSSVSSCVAMFSGGFNAIIGTSYTAEDEDILGADRDYTALEARLAARIADIESEYAGYDEYRYSLDPIGHDPFELASYLTAKYDAYTRAEVQAELAGLITQQYRLTLAPVTETRYRTETRTEKRMETVTETRTGTFIGEDGEEHEYEYEVEVEIETEVRVEVEVPYDYYILNVALLNRSLDSAALAALTPDQYEMYLVYLETKGNKPELFP